MELGAEFVMKPGMLYFLNNHQVYHGRGNWSVTDNEASGSWGKEGRLLFRTWISPYNSRCVHIESLSLADLPARSPPSVLTCPSEIFPPRQNKIRPPAPPRLRDPY